MDAENGPGSWRNRALDQSRIHVISLRLNVDKDRDRAAVTDTIRGSDVGMTHRHNLIARPNSNRQERQMQSSRAAGNSAGIIRPNAGSKLAFECSHFMSLGNPAGEQGSSDRLRFRFTNPGPGNRNHALLLSSFHHSSNRRSPSSNPTRASKPSMRRALLTSASRRGTGLTLRSGPYSGF